MMLVGPADGTAGIILSTDFNWMGVDNALSYNFELATSPAFGGDNRGKCHRTEYDYIYAFYLVRK